MNDRRSILALLLIGVIMLLTPYYIRLVGGPQPPAAPVDTTVVTTGGQAARVDSAAARQAPTRPAPEGLERPGQPVVEEPDQAPGRRITVLTPNYEAVMSSRGGVLERWMLTGYARADEPPIELIPAGAMGLFLDLPLADGRLEGDQILFDSAVPDTIVLGPGESRTVDLSTTLPSGERIEREITFSADTFDVRIVDRLTGFEVTALNDAYRLWWLGGLNFTEPNRREELQYTSFTAMQGGDTHRTKLKRDRVESQLSGNIEWAALRTKYFASVLIPQDGAFRSARMNGVAGDVGPAMMNMAVEKGLSGGGVEEVETLAYLGPMELKQLASYDAGLHRMMDFGFSIIRPIARTILRVFTWMHRFIPNYGLVIILFSVLVKLLVFPLTRKSYESMHAMQELAPKVKEIREKYKDDPPKMNKKMMNLYKERGVNPVGGCFPLLLQMPIFWALFTVFRSTIELRGAPFMLWIVDLSLKDPYMILPGLMGLTMFIQQRAQLKNPQQRPMVIIMPLVLFFFFKGLSAGLILYWTMFNIFSIIQTELVHPPAKAKAA
jgi:YidC/Oxa1 family membrane protein insertase